MRASAFIVLILVWNQPSVKSIQLLEMRTPAHVAEGGEALLGCQFELEEDELYSVKWYKDKQEFFRYVPRGEPSIRYFHTPGVFVDLSRSSSDYVTLTNLTRDSAGLYRCEVSGEAPRFSTVSDEKYIDVFLIPKTGPRITGLKHNYRVGDQVLVNCTSSRSRPESILKWHLNDVPAPEAYQQGPWWRPSAVNPEAIVTILQLKFIVQPRHFSYGSMRLKCQATIAPLYRRETEHTAWTSTLLNPETSPTPEDELDQSGVLVHIPEEGQSFQFAQPTEPTQEVFVEEDDGGHAASIHKSLSMLFLTGLLLVI